MLVTDSILCPSNANTNSAGRRTGIPLFYLELAIGQRMRKAAISCWNLVSPFAAGIGIASAAVSFVIGLYYNTMVAWTILYLWGSSSAMLVDRGASKKLPFSQCPAGDDRRVAQEAPPKEVAPDGSSANSSSGGGGGGIAIETECQVSRTTRATLGCRPGRPNAAPGRHLCSVKQSQKPQNHSQ